MKKATIISLMLMTLLIVALVTVIITQPRNERRDERRGDEVARNVEEKREGGQRSRKSFQLEQIERVLDLDEERATPFRELYMEYIKATSRKEGVRTPFGRDMDLSQLSDQEVEESIQRSFKQSMRAVRIKEEYYLRFREILTPREVATMYEIERRMNERFVDEMRNRKGLQPGRNEHPTREKAK